MTEEELELAEADMARWPVTKQNAADFAAVLKDFLRNR